MRNSENITLHYNYTYEIKHAQMWM